MMRVPQMYLISRCNWWDPSQLPQSASNQLKTIDWSSLIILIGPFLVSENWDPILPWGRKKVPWFLHKNVTFRHSEFLICRLVTSFISNDEGRLGQQRKGCLWVQSFFILLMGHLLICHSLSCFYRKIFRALDFSNVIFIHSHKLINHKHVGQCILKKVAALYNQDPDQETK